MADTSLAKNFDFTDMTDKWLGYVSSYDKTNIARNVMVRGSQNVYKKLSGTFANRPGQKRLGEANATLSPISSEYVWNTSWGATYTLVVSDSKLSVVIDDVWYTLLSGLTETRFVFDKWWDNTEKKDRVLFVNGNDYIQHWSGGFATVASGSNTAISLIGNSASLTSITRTGTATVSSYFNSFTGTSFEGSIVFGSQPTNGQTIILTINGTPVTFTAVSVIGATPGNFLIGATLLDTVNNLVGLLTAPGTTNATQVALSAPNQTLVGYLNPLATYTITKTGSTTWAQAGFSTTSGEQSLVINGTTYTYTGGETTLTLFGVTPDPSGIVANSTALQSVITTANTPADGFENDFIKVINNQVYVGSYTSRLIYISSNTDFSDYTVPSPRAPGDPELLTLDGTGKGIGVRKGSAHIGFGSGSWAVVTFNDITVGSTLTQQTKVDVKPVALLQAPYAHEFIDTVGDSLIYLAQDQQVRMFGDFTNLFSPGYPSVSQEIATELMEENFTGGGLRCIGEFVYVTAPNEGRTYLYQVRQSVDPTGQVVAERLWHSPFIWNVTRIDQIDGVVVGFSNANPQIYQLWDTGQWHDDSPSDEPLPYSCVCALSYRGESRRQGLWSFDKNFTEGYISTNTPLFLRMNYNYNGAANVVERVINSEEQPGYLFTPNSATPSSLGDESLGDEVLGDGIFGSLSDQDALPKFKVINTMPIINCFEWQPVFFSDQADARWEILATATNAKIEKEQDATFIINKVRNS